MSAPNLSISEVRGMLPDTVTDIRFVGNGGQKAVFSGNISGERYALKFLDVTRRIPPQLQGLELENDNAEDDYQADVLARAKREITIMGRCESDNLVKLGPVGMTIFDYHGTKLLYFTEEFIQGQDIKTIILNREMAISEIIDTGIDIARAVNALWDIATIHRDIKPQNVMKRDGGGFLLLDAGLAFDLNDASLTVGSGSVGTPVYKSPEQLQRIRKDLDFRSDLFLIGILMYEALTRKHPFFKPNMTSIDEVNHAILHGTVEDIVRHNPRCPEELQAIVMRLLGKQAHMRYRSIELFINALLKVKEEYS